MKGKLCIWKRILCICILVILVCGFLNARILTAGNTYKVREVKIQYDGYDLEGTLFIPKNILEKVEGTASAKSTGTNVRTAPALVIQGGGSSNRYFVYSYAIELIKRGFVVFALDMYTHGSSEDYAEGFGVYQQVHDAIRYMHSLNYVDDTNIGYVGHSQGGCSTIQALQEHAGYYTIQDMLFNMLYDELGVDVTREQIAAQDADAVAANLDEHDKGYYESRKAEIINEYYDDRITFGMIMGSGTGEGVPLSSGDYVSSNPKVVDVAGVPVFRDIQANIGNLVAFSDEAIGMMPPFLGPLEITNVSDMPYSVPAQEFFGTGGQAIEFNTIYAQNLSSGEERIPATILGQVDDDAWTDPAVLEASANKTLRMLAMYPGWHNTYLYDEGFISALVNYVVIATGYNNGYVSETGGIGGAAFDDTNTWKGALACSSVAFFALLILVLSIAVLLFNTGTFNGATCVAVEPQVSRKSKLIWIFTAVAAILPVLLITPLMNNSPIGASWFTKLERMRAIVFWSLCSAALLLAMIIIKWKLYDKKNTVLSFKEFYGLNGTAKMYGKMLAVLLIVWAVLVGVVQFYYNHFSTANFNIVLPGLNIPIQLTPYAPERAIDYVLYVIYFLPYWLVGSMLVNSARMKDMPDWINTIIISIINFIPIALYVYISYAGNITSNGMNEIFGLKWTILIQMQGLALAIPLGVYNSRVLYKRTGSVIPGALLNAIVFTLPYMCNVVAYKASSFR